jgi:hypothetical protein
MRIVTTLKCLLSVTYFRFLFSFYSYQRVVCLFVIVLVTLYKGFACVTPGYDALELCT